MSINTPTKNFRHDLIQFSNGMEIEVVHNMSDIKGMTNSLYSAAHNWLIRSSLNPDEHQKESMEKSFVEYINDKGVHQAYTVQEYEQLTGKNLRAEANQL